MRRRQGAGPGRVIAAATPVHLGPAQPMRPALFLVRRRVKPVAEQLDQGGLRRTRLFGIVVGSDQRAELPGRLARQTVYQPFALAAAREANVDLPIRAIGILRNAHGEKKAVSA